MVTNLFAYIECLHATSASYVVGKPPAACHLLHKVVPYLLRLSTVDNHLALHLVSGNPKLEIACLFGRFIRRLCVVAFQIKTQRKPQLVDSQPASQSLEFRNKNGNFDNPIPSSIAATYFCFEALYCASSTATVAL